MFRDQSRPVNMARFVFLNPRALDFYPDWDAAAHDTVALLRAESGRDPFNKELSDLVGELSTRSEHFGSRWATHNVRRYTTGVKRFHHPVVGDVELMFNALELTADPGLPLYLYGVEPGSAGEDALKLLGSWAATLVNVTQAATSIAPEDS